MFLRQVWYGQDQIQLDPFEPEKGKLKRYFKIKGVEWSIIRNILCIFHKELFFTKKMDYLGVIHQLLKLIDDVFRGKSKPCEQFLRQIEISRHFLEPVSHGKKCGKFQFV